MNKISAALYIIGCAVYIKVGVMLQAVVYLRADIKAMLAPPNRMTKTKHVNKILNYLGEIDLEDKVLIIIVWRLKCAIFSLPKR